MTLRRKNQPPDPDRIYLGKILKPHGLRGEVKYQPFGSPNELLEWVGPIHIDDSERLLTIEWIRGSDKNPILKFIDVASREQSEAIQGAVLWVEPGALPELDDGFVYESDILHCQVFDEAGNALGRVEEILETGEHDVIVIRGQGKETMLPLHEETLVEMRLSEQTLVVRPPDYMDEEENGKAE